MKIVSNAPLEDWEKYKNLRIEALKNVPQAFLDDPDMAEKMSKEEWQRRMSSMYFAEIDGKWVGMIGAYQEKKTKVKHILNIVSVYVAPSYRGQGIGKALLEYVIEQAKKNPEIKKLLLGVVTTQEPAQELYKSLGFVKGGYLKYAVKVGKQYFDEYLMELYL
ncbi:GNAT family N-acetyltransferase [Candidatus Woesebacteria bacterium]|nr:GNAT family N-acetyltransferase [Candidatus Woesebacteria bacterium]